MSLPAGFLDELRSRVSIARLIGRKVVWDLRKSNQAKGDYWAPCPFHQEKTASFHVDDRKGFYYCFGCQAKGDAVSFLRETENLSFMEAVEALAREAGMTVPARDPAAKARSDRRAQLVELCEAAARFFRMQLNGAGGAVARAYLDQRRMSPATRERFGIGFAPAARQALWSHLIGAGVAPELIEAAGLCARPEGGGAPFDRFRGRIMFPIADARGRCIGFGARAVAAEVQPKYLNSPQTDLFDKGRTLYNLGPARAAMGKGMPLVVAEGYMDVIALVAAGFEGAVAPLGTAITEEQLDQIWRLSGEPVVALDGDPAGLGAGQRLAEMALPRLAAGKGLRFALLPAGADPDDVLGAGGPPAMQALIDKALPISELIWQREIGAQTISSAEDIAAIEARLKAASEKIRDATLRRAFARDINYRINRLSFERLGRRWPKGQRSLAPVLPSTRASRLANGHDLAGEEVREALVLALLFTHPALITRFEDDLWRLDPQTDAHRKLAGVLLDAARRTALPTAAQLREAGGAMLAALLARPHVAKTPLLDRETDVERVALCLAEDFAILAARRSARREIAEAMHDFAGLPDEGLTWRLSQAAAAVEHAARSAAAPTDLGENRAELSSHLQSLIDAQIWVRRRRTGPS